MQHSLSFAVASLIALTQISQAQEKSKQRPNVIMIAVDDMNDWIGSHKTTPSAITPNMDKLAKRGVNFKNAHTAGVFCAPSRAAIFSGQYASTTGCYKSAFYFKNRPELKPLQFTFQESGYKTMGGGKLFHHPAGLVDVRGWDEFFLRKKSQYENAWSLDNWSEEVPFPNPFPNSIYNKGRKVTGGLFLEWGAVPNDKEEELADSMRMNWAVSKVKEKHEQPFFLAVGLYAPHFPNYCPQKYFDMYDPDKIKLPPIKDDDLDDLPEKIKRQKQNRKALHHARLEKLDAVDDAIHGYLACMSYADALIGRLLDALEASPYKDNTVVVLWSDHGYHHGEKGDWGKHTLWERTTNVPFIWAGPGIKKAAESNTTVSLIDMYPTFVELCRLKAPSQKLEGQSIATTLANPATAKDRDVYLPYIGPNSYAVMNRQWRYIRYDDGGEELYQVQDDPNEWSNLLHKGTSEEHQQVIKKLKRSVPKTFAEPEYLYNKHRELIIEGTKFRWEKKPLPNKRPPSKKKKVNK